MRYLIRWAGLAAACLPSLPGWLPACLPTQLQPVTGPTRPALILLKNCQKRLRDGDGDGAETQSEREMKRERGRQRDGEKEAK